MRLPLLLLLLSATVHTATAYSSPLDSAAALWSSFVSDDSLHSGQPRDTALASAKSFLNHGSPAQAIEHLDQVVRLDSLSPTQVGTADRAHVLYQRAVAYLALKRLDRAKHDFYSVIELLSPSESHLHVQARIQLVRVLLRLGEIDEALILLPESPTDSFESLKSKLLTARSNFNTARKLYKEQKWSLCLDVLEQIIDVCPESLEASEMRITALGVLGRMNDVLLGQVLKSISLSPTSIDTLTRGALITLLYPPSDSDRMRAKSYLRSCIRLQDPEAKNGCKSISKQLRPLLSELEYLTLELHNDRHPQNPSSNANANSKSKSEYKSLATRAKELSDNLKIFVKTWHGKDGIPISVDEAVLKSGLVWEALDIGCACERAIKGDKKKLVSTVMCEETLKMKVSQRSFSFGGNGDGNAEEEEDDDDQSDENQGDDIAGKESKSFVCVQGCLSKGETYVAKGNAKAAEKLFRKVLKSSGDEANREAETLLRQAQNLLQEETQKQQEEKRRQQQEQFYRQQHQQQYSYRRQGGGGGGGNMPRPDRKDYYKILDVDKSASPKDIKKAYRKKTLSSHPDKHGGSEEQMTLVNEAFEVLGNDENKRIYDNGGDPLNPQAQQEAPIFQQGRMPFMFHGGGGGPGGGPGGHFKVVFEDIFSGAFTPGSSGPGGNQRAHRPPGWF